MSNPATQFKKGQSGNPKGRPPVEFSFAGKMREFLSTKDPETKQERISVYVEKVYEYAAKGDATAMKLVANYLDGMPKQAVDHTTKGDKLNINVVSYTEAVSDADNPE